MHKTLKITGFILKKHMSRENDLIVTVFSQELGKITCIAKGAQKVSGRRIGALDSLNMVRITLSLHHGFYYLKQVDLISRLELLKKDFEKRKNLLLVAEILEKLLPPLEPEEKIFTFFKQLLVQLSKKIFSEQDITVYIRKLALMLGYAPPVSFSLSLPHFIHSLTEREVVSFKLS